MSVGSVETEAVGVHFWTFGLDGQNHVNQQTASPESAVKLGAEAASEGFLVFFFPQLNWVNRVI